LDKKIILLILLVAVSSLGTAYSLGGTNIIFRTSDGIIDHEVMRITSDQRVGIGTITPQSTLDVNGDVVFNGNFISNGENVLIGNQQCIGKVTTGFDSNGNIICKSINFSPDIITALDSTDDVGTDTSIAIGTDGFPVVSYFDFTTFDLKLVHCTSTTCGAHDTPIALDSTGSVGAYSSIGIGTDGFPVISYHDSSPNHDLKLVHCTSTTCSTHDTPITLDSTGFVGYFTSIAIGTDGFPVISYNEVTNHDLKLVHCSNTSCSTHDIITTLDSTGSVGAYTSIAIGTDGFPVVSYYDYTTLDLKLVHCTSTACGTHDTATTLDSTGDVGQFTSIAIGTDGFPVISYYDDSPNFDLKLVHCTSTACGTHDTPIALDSAGNVGIDTSIAIGTDGFPVVSYYDATNFDLKLVHCTSTSCGTHDTPIPLDSTGNVGTNTSIDIGTDGFPVVSYFDGTNDDLKVALKGGTILS
jgi:hypothetical protein